MLIWDGSGRWLCGAAGSPGRSLWARRWNQAEPGSFSLLRPLEVFGPLGYFLEVETKSLLAAQALGAVLGVLYPKYRVSLASRCGQWQPAQQLQAWSHQFSRGQAARWWLTPLLPAGAMNSCTPVLWFRNRDAKSLSDIFCCFCRNPVLSFLSTKKGLPEHLIWPLALLTSWWEHYVLSCRTEASSLRKRHTENQIHILHSFRGKTHRKGQSLIHSKHKNICTRVYRNNETMREIMQYSPQISEYYRVFKNGYLLTLINNSIIYF